jgi:hypothetical protein
MYCTFNYYITTVVLRKSNCAVEQEQSLSIDVMVLMSEIIEITTVVLRKPNCARN